MPTNFIQTLTTIDGCKPYSISRLYWKAIRSRFSVWFDQIDCIHIRFKKMYNMKNPIKINEVDTMTTKLKKFIFNFCYNLCCIWTPDRSISFLIQIWFVIFEWYLYCRTQNSKRNLVSVKTAESNLYFKWLFEIYTIIRATKTYFLHLLCVIYLNLAVQV